ncbi:MAG: mechanosensitive ion channel family protein [bacterium]
MIGLSALKLAPIDHLISSFFLYLPKIIAAIVIFISGYLLGDFLDRVMVLAAVGSHIPHAKAIGRLTKLAVVLFFLFVSLDLLEIGKNVIVAAFSIVFGGVVLALAIAFGFGAKDIVKLWLEKQIKESDNHKDDGVSHL